MWHDDPYKAVEEKYYNLGVKFSIFEDGNVVVQNLWIQDLRI